MKLHNLQQGSEEWHQLRLGKLTASKAQPIATAGKGLETLCFEKVAELLTGKAPEGYTNADMERGNELEEMARNSYEMETGIVAKEVGFVEESEYVGCSPDGLIGDEGMLEIKCPNDKNFTIYLYDGKVDKQYYWQMQMQMLVAGRKWVDYVVFNPNFPTPIIIQRVEANEKDMDKIRKGLDKGQEMIADIINKIREGGEK